MIINQTVSSIAEYIGEVQENKVGIDRKNIDFITTLLTSNLYSKPLQSFLRETIANAQDSHIEAGNDGYYILLIEEPVPFNFIISVRDYGTGLSPERFESIYRNIGSSTKRSSNEFIGMFGIGRFSCLSVCNAATINSYYKGKKYTYIMYKNNNSINIDKVGEISGDFKDGLEVSIKKDFYNRADIYKTFNELSLFEKLKIVYRGNSYDIKQAAQVFNERKIIKFKNFRKCSNINNGLYFGVGNVLYKASSSELHTGSGLIINIPIGKVDITPNREDLQYSDYTKKNIKFYKEEALKEIKNMLETQCSKNFTLVEYMDTFITYSGINIEIAGVPISISNEDIKEFNTDKMLLEGNTLPPNFGKFLKDVRWHEIDRKLIFKTYNTRFKSRKLNLRSIIYDSYKIFLKKDRITKKETILWLLKNNKNPIIVFSPEGLEGLKKEFSRVVYKNSEECIETLFKALKIQELRNEDVPQSFKEELKGLKKTKEKVDINELKKVPVRLYNLYSYNITNFSYIENPKIIVYTFHLKPGEDQPLRELAYMLTPKVALITVKKEHLHFFENMNNSIELNTFMFTRQKILEKCVTKAIIDEGNKGCYVFWNTPLGKELKIKYKGINYSDSETFRAIKALYIDKKWFNKADVDYFTLSKKEKEALEYWNKLLHNKYEVINKIMFKKFGNTPKIGLTLKELKEHKSYEHY